MSMFTSCNKDELVVDEPEPEIGSGELAYALKEVECTVATLVPESDDIEIIETAESRSELIYDAATGMNFHWDVSDGLTVFSKDGDAEVLNNYVVKGEPNGANARFTLDDFQLSPSAYYVAFGQRMTEENRDRVNVVDRDHVKVDYSGQRQIGNGVSSVNTSHLGKYDFIASAGKADEDNNAHFTFKHLGVTLFLNFKQFWNDTINFDRQNNKYDRIDYAKDVYWTKVEMYADDNDFLQPKREFGLRNGLSVSESGFTYDPAFNAIDIELNRNAARFSVEIREHDNTVEHTDHTLIEKKNLEDPQLYECDHGVKIDANGFLKVFMEIPPIDFKGEKKFIFRLTGYHWVDHDNNSSTPEVKETVTYFCVYKKTKPFKAGTAVQMTMKPRPTSNFIVTMKVHLDWKNKALFNAESSRASVDPIGDPGLFEEFLKPKYLYAWIFADDDPAVVGNRLKEAKKLASINEADWTATIENYILTYDFTFEVRLDAGVEKCILYAVASQDDLGLSTDQTKNSYCENDIRSMTIDLSPSSYQEQIKNIWSTPYTEGDDYVGIVYNGMNANLHHVAAKVDVQWNSAQKVNNFSLTHLHLNGIKLFTPTENSSIQEDKSTLLPNPSFETGENWTGLGTRSDGCATYSNVTFDLYQELTLEPYGVYEITMQGYYQSNDSEKEYAVLYAGEAQTPLALYDADDAIANTKYKNSVIGVADSQGKLKIGVRKTQTVSGDFTKLDDFKLYYCGTSVTVSPNPDEWYNGRHVFYVPQPAPLSYSGNPYNGYTIYHVGTNRQSDSGPVIKNTAVPFLADGVYTSWFRGNVTIQN